MAEQLVKAMEEQWAPAVENLDIAEQVCEECVVVVVVVVCVYVVVVVVVVGVA